MHQGKMEDEKRKQLIQQGKQLKEELAKLESVLDRLEAELQIEGQKMPNSTHPDVRYHVCWLLVLKVKLRLPMYIRWWVTTTPRASHWEAEQDNKPKTHVQWPASIQGP